VNIQRVKKKILAQNRKVIWHPQQAQEWEEEVMSNSPDWTLSRQRYWGAPMPIWVCVSCGDYTVIGSLSELKSVAKNKEEVERMTDLHKPHIDRIITTCKKCGSDAKRIPDILDVWFDSSIAYRASLTEEEFEKLFPMDYILEGRDQLRAWFSYQLKMGVIVNNRRPFNHVGVDGMLLAEDGRQMHKHLGNYVSIPDLLKTTSADSYRLWCIDHTPWLDLQYNLAAIKDAEKALQLLYNVSNLVTEYSNATGYKKAKTSLPKITSNSDLEDAWIVSRMNSTIKIATEAFENYEVYKVASAARGLLIGDISRFYLKIAKKKILYTDKKRAKATLNIANYLLNSLLIVMSPIIPFTAESIYLKHYAPSKKSIFLNKWPSYDDALINQELESEFEVAGETITAILNSREKTGVKLRWPLANATVEVNKDEIFNSLQKLSYLIEDYANVRHLEVKRVEAFNKQVKPVFAKIGPSFKEKAGAVAAALQQADANELLKAISESGHYTVHTEKGTAEITAEHFNVLETVVKDNAIAFKYGVAYVDKEVSKELKDEAMLREFERRVQIARKEEGLKKVDKIILYFSANEELAGVVATNLKRIKADVNAKQITTEPDIEIRVKEYDIEGDIVKIGIKKVIK
jgi:isoleucyl-tRNA synthetase